MSWAISQEYFEKVYGSKKRKNKIMATQAEATQALVKINEVLVKIASETEFLLAEVKKLTDALAAAGGAGGTITPELEAAVKATAERTNAIDELVKDVAPPE